jgi:hypothetical protein
MFVESRDNKVTTNVTGYGKLRTLVKFNILEPEGPFKIQVNCAPVVTTGVRS